MKFFTVGPAELYPSCDRHYQEAFKLQIGSISHRSELFRKIYQHTDEQLRILLNIPSSHRIFFTSSASEIWERMLLNLVDEHSFHFVQGAFSRKFYDYAKKIQKRPSLFEVPDGQPFDDLSTLQIPSETELICFTQNETSSGIRVPEEIIHQIKSQHTKALVCCDIVSAVPYLQLDFSLVDSAFFSVQKGMGLPPGLGVWIVNEACIRKSEHLEALGRNIGAHFTLSAFEKNYKTFETPSTPNTMAIYVLGKVAEEMNRIGISQLRQDTEEKFEALYQYILSEDRLQWTTDYKHHLSRTTIVVNSRLTAKSWNQTLRENQMQIAGGYGSFKDSQIRIANFPAISKHDVERLIHLMRKAE